MKLSENGIISFIVPNKFFKIGSGKKLRSLISNNGFLYQLVDFGDSQLFEEKTIYSSIITLRKKCNDSFAYSETDSVAKLWSESVQQIKIKKESIGETPWRISPDINFMNAMENIDKVAVPITKHIDIYNGIQTSAERPKPIYWFSDSEIISQDDKYYTLSRNDKVYNIEKDILKPYFKPVLRSEKGLNTYSLISTDKHIIFPYDVNGCLISIDIMREKYSGTLQYLTDNYENLKSKTLGGKRDVPNATKDTWYQYGRIQALTSFINTPKLIVGILSKEPMYVYDNNDMLIASGGTAGYCAVSNHADSPYDLLYMQAWLTHPFTEKLLSITGSDFENGFYARGTAILKNLPFVELNFSVPQEKQLHETVVEKTRLILDINNRMKNRIENSKKIAYERQKNQLIREIEELITKVYLLEFRG